MGFLDIERISMETERNLQGFLYIHDLLGRKSFSEIVSGKEAAGYAKKSGEKEGNFIHW